ncbi:hypothetical protein CDEST_10183 [Colletotrichum destructivum]|uniref:Uncharacterized protein n=1 Tax=Colletotrichum destructivum TaxID=34406 RepID=A0AAX4IP23_9PEZI|nr:hypothetical protein CDEST_10183 [Colletotrichum destructivum]
MLQAACGYSFTAGTDQLSLPCRHHFVWMGIFWAPLHRVGKSSPLLLRNDSHHGYVDTVYNLPWKLANGWLYNAGWVEKKKQWSTMRCCWERLTPPPQTIHLSSYFSQGRREPGGLISRGLCLRSLGCGGEGAGMRGVHQLRSVAIYT